METVKIKLQQVDCRLDNFLVEYDSEHTRSYYKKLIENGKVKVNGKVQKAGYKVQLDDVVEIDFEPEEVFSAEPENIPIDVVYEDDDLLVVNKPQGMVVHPAVGNTHGTLVNALAYRVKNLSKLNGQFRAGIVHRLDKDTSGLLVVAKNDIAHANLAKQIADKTAKRTYYAVVQGYMPKQEDTIHNFLARDKKNRLKYTVVDSGGKEAITNYKVLQTYSGMSLVEFELKTGRTHQIRVHCAHIHHPIVGDTLYNPNPCPFSWVKGQLLVAKKLEFVHPTTKQKMCFEIELPQYFQKVIEKLSAHND